MNDNDKLFLTLSTTKGEVATISILKSTVKALDDTGIKEILGIYSLELIRCYRAFKANNED